MSNLRLQFVVALSLIVSGCSAVPAQISSGLAKIDADQVYVSGHGADWVEITNPTLSKSVDDWILLNEVDREVRREWERAHERGHELASLKCAESGRYSLRRSITQQFSAMGYTSRFSCMARDDFLYAAVSIVFDSCGLLERGHSMSYLEPVRRSDFRDDDFWREYRSYVPASGFSCGAAQIAMERLQHNLDAYRRSEDALLDRISDAEAKCEDIGFQPGTTEFGDCVLRVSE